MISNTIIEAEEVALVLLYGGAMEEGFDNLRYQSYPIVSKSSSRVEPQILPQTSAAVKYHSPSVHLQVMEWKELATI